MKYDMITVKRRIVLRAAAGCKTRGVSVRGLRISRQTRASRTNQERQSEEPESHACR